MTSKRNGSLRPVQRTVWSLLAAAAIAVVPASARAVAETGALVLQYPIGLRSNAMGAVGVADRRDPDNIYFNPANVTATNGVYATGSYQLLAPSFSSDVWFKHGTLGGGRSFGTDHPILLALNVTWAKISYGDSFATDSSGGLLSIGESTERYFAMTAGAATVIGDRVECAVGVAFKHAKLSYAPPDFVISFGGYEASGGMVDVGTVVSTTIAASDWSVRPSLGVAAVNLGSDLAFDEDEKEPLPSWFNYGVAVSIDGPVVSLGPTDVPVVTVTIAIDGNHGLNEQHPRWGFGYEFAAMEIASVRWGRRVDDHDRTVVNTWGVGLGVPVGPVRARFDYASVESGYADGYFSYLTTIPRDVYGVSLAWLFDRRAASHKG